MTQFIVIVTSLWCAETEFPKPLRDAHISFDAKKIILKFKDRKKSQSATKSNASEDKWPELGSGWQVTNADEGHNQQCYPHKVM